MDMYTKYKYNSIFMLITFISSFLMIYSLINLIIINTHLSSVPITHPQLGWVPNSINLMTTILVSGSIMLLLAALFYFLTRVKNREKLVFKGEKKVLTIQYNNILKVLIVLFLFVTLYFLADIFRFQMTISLIDLNLIQVGDQIFRFIYSLLFLLIGIYSLIFIRFLLVRIKISSQVELREPLINIYKHRNKSIMISLIYIGIFMIYIYTIGVYGFVSYLQSLPFSIPGIDLLTAEESLGVLVGLNIGCNMVILSFLYLNHLKKMSMNKENVETEIIERKKWLRYLGIVMLSGSIFIMIITGPSSIMTLQVLIVSPVAVVGADIFNLISQYIGVLLPIIGIILGLFLLIPQKKYIRV